MKYKYLYSLFFLIHISINAIPECYVSFDQSKQHQIHPANAWPAQQYKHHKYYGVSYKTAASLRNYSKSDLQLYFDASGYSEKDILSYDVLYMSDEFIELAKTYSDYEDALKKLHKKLSRMSAVQRIMGCIHSTYYPNLLKRVRHLYKELHQYQCVVTAKAKSFAQLYDINLLALFPYSDSLISRNIYKKYIHILDQASNVSLRNGIMRDCIGQASSIGLEANKHGYTQYAFQLADFCFTMLDCAIAFDEGIYLGALQAVDAITHPIETIKNSLIGIGVIAYGLSKLVSVPVECAFLYATDRDCFYLQADTITSQLEKIIDHAVCYFQKTPFKEIIKQGMTIVTEGVLLTRIFTFAHSMSKRLWPIAHNYFEYVAKKEPITSVGNNTLLIESTLQTKACCQSITLSNINTWTSKNGLIYGIDKKFGSRINHILQHTKPNPSKLHHTVFTVTGDALFELIDYAWSKKGLPLINDAGTYIIDIGKKIGTLGETAIKIVTIPGTNNIITAYPIKV